MRRARSHGSAVLLLLSTAAVLAIVPDWPHRHPEDPSYWGVTGFVALAIVLLAARRRSWAPGGGARRAVVAFLALVQLVYVANWFRHGGSGVALGLQLAGLVAWLGAAFAARRSDVVLWSACVVHALWDAGHFARVGFVPEWYAAGCLAADIGLGAFVLLELRQWPEAGPISA